MNDSNNSENIWKDIDLSKEFRMAEIEQRKAVCD